MPKSKSKARATAAMQPQPKRQPRPKPRSDGVLAFYSRRSNAFRYPDKTTTPTALMALPQDLSPGATVEGNLCLAVLPGLSSSYAYNTVTSAGVLAATWAQGAHQQLSIVTTNSKRARLTGARVTVRYTGAEQLTQGMMYVGSSPDALNSMYSASTGTYTPQMQAYPIKAGGEWVFYLPMLTVPDLYDSPSSSTFMQSYFSSLVFIFTGLPTSATGVTVRVDRSIEYVPELSSQVLCNTMSEPFDPVADAEAGVLSGMASETGTDDGPGWAAKVGQALYGVIRGAGEGAARDLNELVNNPRMILNEL